MGRNHGCVRITVAVGLRDCIVWPRCSGGRTGRRQGTSRRETAVCTFGGGGGMTISSNQVSRMLALVPYLRNRGEIPVEDVARDFAVPVKQIVRDLSILWFCGLPNAYPGDMISIDMDALKIDGVVKLSDADFLPKPSRFSPYEALALIVALRTIRATATPDQAHIIDTALAKLEEVCGDVAKAPVDVHVEAADPQIQSTLETALADRVRVAIRYTTPARDEENEREIDPIRMFTAQGRLFCEAWCYLADDVRIFRLDRILSADATRTPMQSHDLEPRDLSEDMFQVSDDTEWVILDLQPAAYWLAEYYTIESLREPVDGVWRVKMFASGMEWMRRLVLKNAGAVTVVEPAALAEDVAANARLALTAYDGNHLTPED